MRSAYKYINLLFVVFCMVLTIILSLFTIGSKGFSMDEFDSYFITQDWGNMLHFIRYNEINMSLYYVSLYFWQYFGHTAGSIRLLSALFAIATIPIVYLLGRDLFSSKVGRIASFILSLHTFIIFNAQNARSYTMVLFFTTLSSYLFVKYMHNGMKKFLFFAALINILAVYSHLYAVFVIGAQILCALLTMKNRVWRDIIVAYALTAIGLLPFLFAPSIHGQISWITKPDIKNLIGTYLILSDDYPFLGGLYLLIMGAFILSYWRKRRQYKHIVQSWRYQLLFLWILFPICSSYVISLLMKPIYISAYFFICVVPFTLCVSLCIAKIHKKWLLTVVLILIILLSFIRLHGWYTGSKTNGLVIRNYNEDFSGAAAVLTQNTQRGDGIIFLPASIKTKINYYIPVQQAKLKTTEIDLQPSSFLLNNITYPINQKTLAHVHTQYGRIWYVLETVTDKKVDADNAFITASLLAQYHLTKTIQLEAIKISKYEK